jgi:hypothetical protein
VLSGRVVEYQNGRIGLHVMPSGTDVMLQFARVEARARGDAPHDGATEHRAVELSLRQNVARMQSLGDWRLLMAARLESLDVGEGETLQAQALDTLGHRLSAGLSVEF